MSCPFIETCPAFTTIMLEEDKSYLAWAFCRTVYADCGRYKATIAGDYVPEGLMPTGEIAIPVGVRQSRRNG